MFKLSERSESRLVGVHPDLQKVVRRALELSKVDFSVSEGIRTYARQKELVAAGKSKTMNSRHLSGHAVDLYPVSKAGAEWVAEDFSEVVDAMKRAAKALGVPMAHGHDWKNFPDSPHHELHKLSYP
jgi:peptidoglycan L-alanyl-D-glutamate endopeptidase CwlK